LIHLYHELNDEEGTVQVITLIKKLTPMEKKFLSFMDYFFTVLLYLSGDEAFEKAKINHIL
jgi:hypothetical protein